MCMSYAATSNIQYRLAEADGGTVLTMQSARWPHPRRPPPGDGRRVGPRADEGQGGRGEQVIARSSRWMALGDGEVDGRDHEHLEGRERSRGRAAVESRCPARQTPTPARSSRSARPGRPRCQRAGATAGDQGVGRTGWRISRAGNSRDSGVVTRQWQGAENADGGCQQTPGSGPADVQAVGGGGRRGWGCSPRARNSLIGPSRVQNRNKRLNFTTKPRLRSSVNRLGRSVSVSRSSV